MRFGSTEWLEAVVAAANAHPRLPEALSGLGPDAAVVVQADPPVWPRTVTAWAEQRAGRIGRFRILDDEDELLELEPAYVFRAPYRIVKGLLEGADPLQAAVSGRVRVEGDLAALVRRAQHRRLFDEILASVPTELP